MSSFVGELKRSVPGCSFFQLPRFMLCLGVPVTGVRTVLLNAGVTIHASLITRHHQADAKANADARELELQAKAKAGKHGSRSKKKLPSYLKGPFQPLVVAKKAPEWGEDEG